MMTFDEKYSWVVRQVEYDHGKLQAASWSKGKNKMGISTLAAMDDDDDDARSKSEEEKEGAQYVTKEELMALGIKIEGNKDDVTKKTCWNCGSELHLQWQCPTGKGKGKGKGKGGKGGGAGKGSEKGGKNGGGKNGGGKNGGGKNGYGWYNNNYNNYYNSNWKGQSNGYGKGPNLHKGSIFNVNDENDQADGYDWRGGEDQGSDWDGDWEFSLTNEVESKEKKSFEDKNMFSALTRDDDGDHYNIGGDMHVDKIDIEKLVEAARAKEKEKEKRKERKKANRGRRKQEEIKMRGGAAEEERTKEHEKTNRGKKKQEEIKMRGGAAEEERLKESLIRRPDSSTPSMRRDIGSGSASRLMSQLRRNPVEADKVPTRHESGGEMTCSPCGPYAGHKACHSDCCILEDEESVKEPMHSLASVDQGKRRWTAIEAAMGGLLIITVSPDQLSPSCHGAAHAVIVLSEAV